MAKKLTDMKITGEEQKKASEAMKIGSTADMPSARYPYGLELRLDNEALEKLGMKTLPKAGTKIYVTAVCSVTGTHQNDRIEHGKKAKPNRSLELQIQKLSLDDSPDSMEAAIDRGIEDAD